MDHMAKEAVNPLDREPQDALIKLMAFLTEE